MPPELERIIKKALAKETEERYQTAKELLIDLKSLKQEMELGKARTVSPPATAARAKSASRRLIVGLGLLLVAAATMLYLFRSRIWPTPTNTAEPITLAILPFIRSMPPMRSAFSAPAFPTESSRDWLTYAKSGCVRQAPILRYEGQKVSAQGAGRELASDYVVMGTVQKVGDRLHVNVQLVRTSDETPLWGDQFDKERTDLLSLQDAVATQIAEALRIKMTSEEQSRVYRRYTDNTAAYELYLLGRSKLVRYTKDDTLAAVKAFEDALHLDGNYALAHAGLAEASAQMRIRFSAEGDVKLWDEQAKRAANRALELDPGLAEAHEALASVYRSSEFNWEQTIAESDRALQMNPNLDQSHYYRAAAFYHLGLLELAEREVNIGLQINPINRLEALRTKGAAALIAGNYSDAVALLEEARRLSSAPVIDWYLAQAYYYKGERDRAEKMLSELRGSAQAEQRAKATFASFLATRGEKQQAQKKLDEIFAGSYMDHHVHYSVGVTYAQLGDQAKARLWLGRAITSGFPCYPWFQRDPLLQPVQADPEFQRMMQDLQKSWMAAQVKYR